MLKGISFQVLRAGYLFFLTIHKFVWTVTLMNKSLCISFQYSQARTDGHKWDKFRNHLLTTVFLLVNTKQ